MGKFAVSLLVSLVGATAAQAAPVYGWNIKCVGNGHLEIHAYQSDDGFYIRYTGSRVGSQTVPGSTEDQLDSDLTELSFTTLPGARGLPEVELYVSRDGRGFGFGMGTFTLQGEAHSVECFVRYGESEESYKEIEDLAFPKIRVPESP